MAFKEKEKRKESGDLVAEISLAVEKCDSLERAYEYVVKYIRKDLPKVSDLHTLFRIQRGLSLGTVKNLVQKHCDMFDTFFI